MTYPATRARRGRREEHAPVLADGAEGEDYAARAVESAEEALTLLAHEDFFMVITDARLGGMSGYEFLAKIHNQWPDLPVLMLTGLRHAKTRRGSDQSRRD